MLLWRQCERGVATSAARVKIRLQNVIQINNPGSPRCSNKEGCNKPASMMVFVEHMAPRRSGIRSNAATTDVPIKYRAEEFASRMAPRGRGSCVATMDVPIRPRTHGSKRKRCSHEGCTRYPQKGGVCVTHGENVKQCRFEAV